ncbi:MAG: mechanosensitive ion channel [Rickettsiales bacterium]|nr:mechanosensitive ion channel [Rickettsiales bacterium]
MVAITLLFVGLKIVKYENPVNILTIGTTIAFVAHGYFLKFWDGFWIFRHRPFWIGDRVKLFNISTEKEVIGEVKDFAWEMTTIKPDNGEDDIFLTNSAIKNMRIQRLSNRKSKKINKKV